MPICKNSSNNSMPSWPLAGRVGWRGGLAGLLLLSLGLAACDQEPAPTPPTTPVAATAPPPLAGTVLPTGTRAPGRPDITATAFGTVIVNRIGTTTAFTHAVLTQVVGDRTTAIAVANATGTAGAQILSGAYVTASAVATVNTLPPVVTPAPRPATPTP